MPIYYDNNLLFYLLNYFQQTFKYQIILRQKFKYSKNAYQLDS